MVKTPEYYEQQFMEIASEHDIGADMPIPTSLSQTEERLQSFKIFEKQLRLIKNNLNHDMRLIRQRYRQVISTKRPSQFLSMLGQKKTARQLNTIEKQRLQAQCEKKLLPYVELNSQFDIVLNQVHNAKIHLEISKQRFKEYAKYSNEERQIFLDELENSDTEDYIKYIIVSQVESSIDQVPNYSRRSIPDEVKIFVWRRDEVNVSSVGVKRT